MEYTNIGELISEARRSKGMTQKDLADRLHITDKAVSKWETGASCPDIATIPKLADLLGISTDALLRSQRAGAFPSGRAPSLWKRIGGTVHLVLQAVSMAMGVAALTLSALGKLENQTAITMLAIGLTCGGIAQLRGNRDPEK